MKPPESLISPDHEAALVAAALTDSAAFLQDVAPSDFNDSQLAALWAAGQELMRQGVYVDSVTLEDELRERGTPVPLTRLAQLQALDVLTINAPTFAEKVRDLAARRRAVAELENAARSVYQSNGTWRDDLTDATRRVARLTERPTAPKVAHKTSWTAAELLAAEFPDPVWIVPDLITVGLTLLAGRPKVGKSWLALQTAIAVGAGGRVLDRPVKPGKVLYLALEDNARRLQTRIRKQGLPGQADIRFELAWPLLTTQDGLDRLDAAIMEYSYTLIIVDTIGRALGRADTQDWTDMNFHVGALQELAHAHDVAILCLDHHRKPTGFNGDPVDDIVGSTAKSAVADCLIGLYREQGKPGAKLSVRGRDIEDAEWALTWDTLTCCWQYAGTVEEAALQGNRGRIIDALRESGAPMTLTDIAKATDLGKNNLQPILADMTANGLLERLPKQGRDMPYRLRGV